MEHFKLRRPGRKQGRAARETLFLVRCSLDSDTRLTPSDPVAADGCARQLEAVGGGSDNYRWNDY